MNTITQTEEWFRITREFPEITAANERFDALLQQLIAKLPEDEALLYELESASNGVAAAFADAATLYGINVGLTIKAAATDPVQYSQYVMASKLPVTA